MVLLVLRCALLLVVLILLLLLCQLPHHLLYLALRLLQQFFVEPLALLPLVHVPLDILAIRPQFTDINLIPHACALLLELSKCAFKLSNGRLCFLELLAAAQRPALLSHLVEVALQLQLVFHQQSVARNSPILRQASCAEISNAVPVHRGVGDGFQLLQAAHTPSRKHVLFLVE